MGQLTQTLAAALEIGPIYSLLALSLVFVYRASRTVNFGQGEIATFSTFVAMSLVGNGIPLFVALLIAAAVGFATCGLTYLLLMRPFRADPHVSFLLVGAALCVGINALSGVVWDTNTHAFASPFPNDVDDYIRVDGTRVYYSVIGNLVVLGLVTLALALMLSRTKIGLEMRAVAANQESAGLSGIAVNRVLLVSWGIGGVLGAIAGALQAPAGGLSTQLMVDILLYSLAAATLGGLDSIKGAVVGGLGVAVITNLLATYVSWIGQDLKQATAMALIVIVLVFKPSGVFGAAIARRA